jgi:hypothetical protein
MIEQEFFSNFTQGVKLFFQMAVWPYIVLNMVWVFILYRVRRRQNLFTGTRLAFLNKVPRAWYVVLQSLILATLWAYFFRMSTREEFAGLFFSISLSMIAYKLGFYKIFKNE